MLLLCLVRAGAADEVAAAGDALRAALPAQAQGYLDGIGADSAASDLTGSLARLLDDAAADGDGALRAAMRCLVRVAAVVVLTAAACGFSTAAGGAADTWIDMAGALGCAVVLLQDFTGVLALCRDSLEQIALFSGTLQPVLATALSTGGQVTTATALQAATMLVFDLTIRLVNGLLVPAVCAYLAMVAVDAATGNGMLRGVADGIKGLVAGALKLILTLFTAYLTIAGGVSGSVDQMALKTAKFAVSGAVPVVGGVIADATETVLSGAVLLKNAVGVFGLLCVTALCLSPFLRAGASYLCYKAGAAVLAPLCTGGLRQLMAGVGTGFGLLLGMLSTCCLILYLELVYVVAMVGPT